MGKGSVAKSVSLCCSGKDGLTMAKRLNRKSKLPGRCIFCGGGNLSKEHFWPEWASALLPRHPTTNISSSS